MRRIDKRFVDILLKWTAIGCLIIGLWTLRIFHLMFVLGQLFIQEVNKGLVWIGNGTKMGFHDYWSSYLGYWLAAYLALTLIFIVWYFA
jgi:hypothetical protein